MKEEKKFSFKKFLKGFGLVAVAVTAGALAEKKWGVVDATKGLAVNLAGKASDVVKKLRAPKVEVSSIQEPTYRNNNRGNYNKNYRFNNN